MSLAEVQRTWWDLAACNGIGHEDPDFFFPDPSDDLGIAQARSICYQCPIREACLEYALANGIRDGVWGGVFLERGTPKRKKQCCPCCESTDLTSSWDGRQYECISCGQDWEV